MTKTVEVPIAWIERLVELGKNTEVSIAMSGLNQWHKNDKKLQHLKGYIESAEQFLEETDE